MNFIRPCEGRVTSFAGARFHPIDKVWRGHHGIDIAKSGKVPIKASESGTIHWVRPDGTFGGLGNCITIRHAGGWISLYGHLASFSVKAGQTVKQGQVIGYMGSTGNSTGQHLHFEIHKGPWNNSYTNEVNPLTMYKDPDVINLQAMLVKVGIKVTQDGYFGPASQKAVEDFQRAHKLTVDGNAGPMTMAALQKAAGSTGSGGAMASASTLKLQKLLIAAGEKIAADGHHGAATTQAIKNFQKKNGLVADGIAGAKTMELLNNPKKEETEVEYKKDAQPSASLAQLVKRAVELKITDGTYPHRPATREEMAVVGVNARDSAIEGMFAGFAKDAQPSASLEKLVKEAVDLEITDGTYPQRPSTREETAAMCVNTYRAIIAEVEKMLKK